MAEELDYKSVLRKSLNLLLEDLGPLPILDYFIQDDFLTPLRIRYIQELGTTTEKNRAIVNSLGGKGLKGYRKFKQFLRGSCQGHLADRLEKFEEKVKAEQSSKPRVNSTMQRDRSNAGRNTHGGNGPGRDGANSRGLATIEGGQNAMNIFGGKTTNYGPINIGSAIGGNRTMQPDGWNAGRDIDGNPNDRLPRWPGEFNISDERQSGFRADGANSNWPTIHQGGQNAINIYGGENTYYGPINIGGNVEMQGDGLNRGLNTDGNHGQGQPKTYPGFENIHELVNQPTSQTQPSSTSKVFHQNSESYDAHGRNQMGATGTQQSSEILYTRESAPVQQGANWEGDDMMDAAPTDDSSSRNQQVNHEQADLTQQMQQLEMHEHFPPTIVNKTETYCEDIADGRVIDVDGKALEKEIKEGIKLQSGGSGEVYCSKEIIEQWGFKIVVKKIPCTELKLQSVVNEIVAARMKHQGIVPLLAKTNYKDKDHAYFVFPYMENGDLMNAIREDMERITKKEKVHMSARKRVLILYQIACAMYFIHTPVKGFRGSVIHGDITTRNIVLDKKYNAHLLDFGVARELEFDQDSIKITTGQPIGTPGYTTVHLKKELSPTTDCENFGVELLTGEVPKIDHKTELKKVNLDRLRRLYNVCHKSIWGNNERVYRKLKNLADKCLKEETDSKSLAGSLHEILRDDFNFDWEKERGETSVEETGESKERCSLCIINWAVKDLHNLRLDGCVLKKKHISPPVCVPCMRNSYLNPITCQRCRKTIYTNIGNSWGAILVEGFATDEDGIAFNNDVKSMEKLLTSKYPLVFGLDPANVISTTMEGLNDAVDKLKDKANIATILVYYSGHYSSKGKCFPIKSHSNWEIKKFSNDLERIKTKIILVLDCCEAGDIEVESCNIKLRINSSRPYEDSRFNEHGSIFTKFFIQATRNDQCHEQCRICESYKPDSLQKGFIFREPFFFYIMKHIAEYCRVKGVSFKPQLTDNKEEDTHFCIGYHIVGKREIKFDLEGGNDYYTIEDLPCEMSELRNLLLKKILKNKFKGDEEWSDYWKDNGKRWQNVSDAIRVTITKGPGAEHKSELNNIPEVMDAWNKKFELNFGFRDVENIENGKVGVILGDIYTQQVVNMLKTTGDHYKDCFELDKVDEPTKAIVLYQTFLDKDPSEDQVPQWLIKTVEDIDRNQKLQHHPAKKLIITVLPELRNERFTLKECFLMMEIPE